MNKRYDLDILDMEQMWIEKFLKLQKIKNPSSYNKQVCIIKSKIKWVLSPVSQHFDKETWMIDLERSKEFIVNQKPDKYPKLDSTLNPF